MIRHITRVLDKTDRPVGLRWLLDGGAIKLTIGGHSKLNRTS